MNIYQNFKNLPKIYYSKNILNSKNHLNLNNFKDVLIFNFNFFN